MIHETTDAKYYDVITGNLFSYTEWCELLDVDDIEELVKEGLLTVTTYNPDNGEWENVG